MFSIPRETDEDGDYVSLRKSTLSWMGFFVKDLEDPTNSFPNRHWIEYGYGLEEMDHDRWLEKIHPDDRARAMSLLESETGDDRFRGSDRYRVRDARGRYHWVLSAGAVDERFPDGSPKRFVGLDFDVTEIHELQEQLSAARETAERQAAEAEVLRNAAAAIVSTLDKAGAIVRVIDELRGMMPITTALVFELQGRELHLAADPEVVEVGDGTTRPSAQDRELFEHGVGRDVLVDVMRRRGPDMFREPQRAGTFWLVAPLIVRGEVMGVYAVGRHDGTAFVASEFRVVTAVADYLALAFSNAQLYAEVKRLAHTDELSGLLTRRALFGRAEELIAQVSADGTQLSCILLDIDHFKDVNDSYGHQEGDEVIRQVAEVFSVCVRANDTVGRHGGEEFCAFLPGTAGDEAHRVAQRICRSVRDLSLERVPRRVTVSLGVAEMTPGEDLDGLIGRADAALYRAKRGGRDRVEYDG